MDETLLNNKIQNVFNPIKQNTGDIRVKRIIWSTQSIQLALKAKGRGQQLSANPFFDGNMVKLLKPDLVFERTEWEINEWQKCKNNIIYFANTYCKLMTPTGIQSIILRDYQEAYLKHLVQNRLSIFLSCRQSGKTTTTAIFILWFIIFNVDKNTLVLGNKRKTAVEILDKLKKIYLELPYFLKPGIYKWNESQIVLDNGCMCMAESTTENSGISFTFHCVLADEFAHISENIAEKFYSNIFPTIIAGNARFIISSTQNGYNLFYKLWNSAIANENDYASFKVDWWQVPDWDSKNKKWIKRTETWQKKQIANLGGVEAFNNQFGTNFMIKSNTLISSIFLEKLQMNIQKFQPIELPGINNADSFYWKPNIKIEELKQYYIIITSDLAEGCTKDYTVFIFWRLLENSIDCIGYFRSNILILDQCIDSLLALICTYFNTNNILLSWEKNTYGDYFYKVLLAQTDLDSKYSNFDTLCLVKYNNIYGIKLTTGNKTPACINFKYNLEKNIIQNTSDLFLIELEKFSTQDNGKTYQASFGHDDIVMASIQLIFVIDTAQFKYLKDDLLFNKNNIETENYSDIYSILNTKSLTYYNL